MFIRMIKDKLSNRRFTDVLSLYMCVWMNACIYVCVNMYVHYAFQNTWINLREILYGNSG